MFAENQGWYTFWHLSRPRANRRNSSPMLISPSPINKKKNLHTIHNPKLHVTVYILSRLFAHYTQLYRSRILYRMNSNKIGQSALCWHSVFALSIKYVDIGRVLLYWGQSGLILPSVTQDLAFNINKYARDIIVCRYTFSTQNIIATVFHEVA